MQSDLIVNNVRDFGAVGNGTTDDGTAIAAALSAAASNRGDVVFPPGKYAYATSPNFAVENVSIIGLGRVLLRHTGTGDAVLFDGTGAPEPAGRFNCTFSNFSIIGNSNSVNALHLRRIHYSRFENINIYNAGSVGLRTNFAVADYFENLVISTSPDVGWLLPDVVTGTSMPNCGIFLTRFDEALSGSGEETVACTFVNTLVGGLLGKTSDADPTKGAGIFVRYGHNNVFIGGASERNNRGIVVSAASDVVSRLNSFSGMFLEANLTEDVLVQGAALRTSFHNLYVHGPGPTRFRVVNAKQTLINGGLIRTSNPVDSDAITLEPMAEDTTIANVATTVLDNGVRTRRQGNFQNQNLGPPYTYSLYEDVLTSGLRLTSAPVLTLDEAGVTPAAPTTSNQARVYVKADKLIVQWKDGGSVRYKYLSLPGTTTTWTHTTTAP